jgi:hypothetical protein
MAGAASSPPILTADVSTITLGSLSVTTTNFITALLFTNCRLNITGTIATGNGTSSGQGFFTAQSCPITLTGSIISTISYPTNSSISSGNQWYITPVGSGTYSFPGSSGSGSVPFQDNNSNFYIYPASQDVQFIRATALNLNGSSITVYNQFLNPTSTNGPFITCTSSITGRKSYWSLGYQMSGTADPIIFCNNSSGVTLNDLSDSVWDLDGPTAGPSGTSTNYSWNTSSSNPITFNLSPNAGIPPATLIFQGANFTQNYCAPASATNINNLPLIKATMHNTNFANASFKIFNQYAAGLLNLTAANSVLTNATFDLLNVVAAGYSFPYILTTTINSASFAFNLINVTVSGDNNGIIPTLVNGAIPLVIVDQDLTDNASFASSTTFPYTFPNPQKDINYVVMVTPLTANTTMHVTKTTASVTVTFGTAQTAADVMIYRNKSTIC